MEEEKVTHHYSSYPKKFRDILSPSLEKNSLKAHSVTSKIDMQDRPESTAATGVITANTTSL